MKSGRSTLLLSWLSAVLLLIALVVGGVQWLWLETVKERAVQAQGEIASALRGELAEGNLFRLSAAIGQLKQRGSIDEGRIYQVSDGGGQEQIYRTFEGEGVFPKLARSGAAACPRDPLALAHWDGTVEVRSQLSNEAGVCTALELKLEPSASLEGFKNRLVAGAALVLAAFVAVLLGLNLAWSRRLARAEYRASLEELEASAALGRLAAQMAHDIRSPLVALNAVVANLSGLPEDAQGLIRSATSGIREIADGLLERGRKSRTAPEGFAQTETSPQCLALLIEDAVLQGNLRHGVEAGRIVAEVPPAAAGVFALGHKTEIRRILANLIDNAAQASAADGRIRVELALIGDLVELAIVDSGVGIAPELLGRLGQRGASFGKKDGNGLGLYHARRTVEGWGGRCRIESTPGRGTRVTLSFKSCPSPAWFVSELRVPSGALVVVIDDQPSVRDFWKSRLLGPVECLSSGEELRSWCAANIARPEPRLFLLDHDLSGPQTGLELAALLGISSETVLVTGRQDEVLEQAVRQGIRVLPKAMLNQTAVTAEA